MRSELDSWAFCAYKIGGRSELKGSWFPPSSDGAGRSVPAKNGARTGTPFLAVPTATRDTSSQPRRVSIRFVSFRAVRCRFPGFRCRDVFQNSFIREKTAGLCVRRGRGPGFMNLASVTPVNFLEIPSIPPNLPPFFLCITPTSPP
jgi:hypothetical protein